MGVVQLSARSSAPCMDLNTIAEQGTFYKIQSVACSREASPPLSPMAPSPSSVAEADPQPHINGKNKMVFAVDETPTPSRYIRHQYGCEDLFEEVCTGLNPFDEQFRRASQARSQSQINLESSTPHIMAVSPRLNNLETSYQSDFPSQADNTNSCHNSKLRDLRAEPNVSDDESLDTPRIIPPTPADSDHTISSTSRDDLCHRYQQRHYGYDSNIRDSTAVSEEEGRRADCGCNHIQCTALPHIQEQNNQYCVSSSQLCVPQKRVPFRSLSELSAKMSCSDVTTVTDDEGDEVSGQKRNSPEEDDDEDEICVDDNGDNIDESESRAIKRRRTDNFSQQVDEVKASSRKRHQTSYQESGFGHDDLQVVSDTSMNESDEGYSSVRYPPSCHEEGTSGYQPSNIFEDHNANSKDSVMGANIRSCRRNSDGRAGLGGRQKLSINVTSAAEAGKGTSSVISTPTPVITAGPSLTQCLRDSPAIEDRPSAPSSSPPNSRTAVPSHYTNSPIFPSSNAVCTEGGSAAATVITGPALPPASPSATVLQLFLRLPNGQAIPVEIPATPLVSTPTTPVPLSSAQVLEQPPQSVSNKPSLAKMRLKAALTASQSAARPASRPPPSRALTAHRIASLTRPPAPPGAPPPRASNSQNTCVHASDHASYSPSSVDASAQSSNAHDPAGACHTPSTNNMASSSISRNLGVNEALNNHNLSAASPANISTAIHLASEHNPSTLPLPNNPNSNIQAASNNRGLQSSSNLQATGCNRPLDQSVNNFSTVQQSLVSSHQPMTGDKPGPVPAANSSSAQEGPVNNYPSKAQKGKKRVLAAPPEDEEEEKRMKFLERNRAAAVRCREKKKEWVKRLASKSTELATVNTRLQAEVASLRAEVATLKALLLQHKTCPVTLATIRGANPDTAETAAKEAPTAAVPPGINCDAEPQLKPRSRSLSLPTMQQASSNLPASAQDAKGSHDVDMSSSPVTTTVTMAVSDCVARLPYQKEASGGLVHEVSAPADMTYTNSIARPTVLSVPMITTSALHPTDNCVSVPITVAAGRNDPSTTVSHPPAAQPQLSSATHSAVPFVTHASVPTAATLIQATAVHPHFLSGTMQPQQQHHPTLLSINQPVAMTGIIAQQPNVVTMPNFSQTSLYSTSAPTFVSMPSAAQVPFVFPHQHHIQRLPVPALQQPQAIAPASAKTSSKSSRPQCSKEHFTLTSLAASLQFVQSSLTSSSRILASLGSSELNEMAAARAAVAGVPGFSSANLAMGSKSVVLEGSVPRLLLPSIGGQPMPGVGPYVQGPLLSAQHIQHTTLTQHLSVPLSCVDDAPSTAAIIEDIAEIEESSSKMVSITSHSRTDLTNTSKLRYSPSPPPHSMVGALRTGYSPPNGTCVQVSGADTRQHDSDCRSNLTVQSVPHAARSAMSREGKASNYFSIPTIVVSDETADRGDDHTDQTLVKPCQTSESYHVSVSSGSFPSMASVQPSGALGIPCNNDQYSLSSMHDDRLREPGDVHSPENNLQVMKPMGENSGVTLVSVGSNVYTAPGS
ncbi:Basic-leucine zipper domain [Trinorchestia longiramus]|nr:Basic-leucine zipper domain [Trinorchestia longiramus]